YGTGVNDAGQVVGYSRVAGDVNRGGFLYDGTMHDIGTLGLIGATTAWDVNNNGQVVGGAAKRYGIGHAFLYDGTMYDLGTLGGTHSEALAINDAGQITGWARTASGAMRAFFYDGTMHNL